MSILLKIFTLFQIINATTLTISKRWRINIQLDYTSIYVSPLILDCANKINSLSLSLYHIIMILLTIGISFHVSEFAATHVDDEFRFAVYFTVTNGVIGVIFQLGGAGTVAVRML